VNLSMDHIHIRCIDPEKSLAFYTEILGGEFLGRGEVPGMPIIRVNLGGVNLALSPRKEGVVVEPFTGKPGYGAYELGYRVEDLDQTCESLKAKGVEIKAGPVTIREGLKVAFLDAPDGVEIELMEVG